MNAKLWNQVVAFNFDKPNEEYSFSIRLANENKWTKAFTQKAILEYKKFMYLAATADSMVSPSEIVDVVWHQHLIFTKSYRDFCELLGRQIQHIPSTHNPEEFDKFRQAKVKTQEVYTQNFGEQPEDIWQYREMYDSLGFKKAKLSASEFFPIAAMVGLAFIFPAYYLLRPMYETIDGPKFIGGYICLIMIVGLILYLYNAAYYRDLMKQFSEQSFVFDLHPLEVLYMFTGSVPLMLHGYVHQLINDKKIRVSKDEKLTLNKKATSVNEEEHNIFKLLRLTKSTSYSLLLQTLSSKHIFKNIGETMDAFKERFQESKAFTRLYAINFMLIGGTFVIGLSRLITGVMRDKPVFGLIVILLSFSIVSLNHLKQLARRLFTTTIPEYYKSQMVHLAEAETAFAGHSYVLSTAFIAASYLDLPEVYRKSPSGNAYCGSDSSCGSSGGGSCGGGCGGGGCGGCGGCGG